MKLAMPNHLYKFAIFLVAIFQCGVANSIDLMQSYELALVSDPVYRSATKEYEATLENKNIGKSALYPKLVASYNASTNKATQWGQQFPGGPDISYNWRYPSDFAAAQITQPLFSLDAFARWRQGIAQTDVGKSKFLFHTQDLLIRVTQAYVDLLFALDQYQYLKIENEAFREQAKTLALLFQKGESVKTDVLEAQATYKLSEAKLIDSKDMIENARRKLNSIIGGGLTSADEIIPLVGNFSVLPIGSNNFKHWEDRAIDMNTELLAMKGQVEVAYQEYKKNNAGHYPVINLIAAITTQSSNTVSSINQTTNQNYLGVQVNLPLYSGGEIVSKSTQAYANYEKAKADYAVTKDRIIIDLRKQYDLLQSGQTKIAALISAKESSELLVQAMKKNVRTGEKIYLDTLLAQKTLFLVSRDLAQSKYIYLLAFLKLHQLSGSLEIDDFQKITQYFKS